MKRSTVCWKLFYVALTEKAEENGRSEAESFLEEGWGEQRLEV
ncbi:hypothetical protein [Paenibacillus barcinonensis]|nr:hypothetical protein [Paenibacillus barcinonensis]